MKKLPNYTEKPEKDELLSRFVFNSSKFNVEKKEVHWRHFEPLFNEASGTHEISVMRISDYSSEDVKKVGFGFVGKERGRDPRGRLDFVAALVYELSLDVEPEVASHARHANIVGWEKRDEDRLEQAKLFAKKISCDKSCRFESYE